MKGELNGMLDEMVEVGLILKASQCGAHPPWVFRKETGLYDYA